MISICATLKPPVQPAREGVGVGEGLGSYVELGIVPPRGCRYRGEICGV